MLGGSDLNIVVKLVDQASKELDSLGKRVDKFGNQVDEGTQAAQGFTKVV